MIEEYIRKEYPNFSQMDAIEKARLFFTIYEDLKEIFGIEFICNLDVKVNEISNKS